MGDFVRKEVSPPDLILSSAASRAFYTALFFADCWNYEERKVVMSEVLYHADAHGLASFLKEADEYATVAMFGHNPGLTSFYNQLCDEFIENIPTCGVVGLSFEIDSWKEIKTGKRLFFHVPKKI